MSDCRFLYRSELDSMSTELIDGMCRDTPIDADTESCKYTIAYIDGVMALRKAILESMKRGE